MNILSRITFKKFTFAVKQRGLAIYCCIGRNDSVACLGSTRALACWPGRPRLGLDARPRTKQCGLHPHIVDGEGAAPPSTRGRDRGMRSYQRTESDRLNTALSLLFLVTQVTTHAAVLDFSGSLPVTASHFAGRVTYSVIDQGQVRGGSDAADNAVFDFSNVDGMVVWRDDSTVYMRFYDPALTNWVGRNVPSGPPQDLRNVNGVVVWYADRSLTERTVHMAAYDQTRGRWATNSEGPGATLVNNLASADGVVAWSRTSGGVTRVYYRVYDPVRGAWMSRFTDLNTGSVFPRVRDGIVAWRSVVGFTTTTYYRTYDPARGLWQEGSKDVVATVGTDPVTAPGVVAWSVTPGGSPAIIYYRAYDPTRGQWREGESMANNPFNLTAANGTVSWTQNGQARMRGYRVSSGAWDNGVNSSTLPYAYFVASTNAGNPLLPVYFIDMSLGAGFSSWDFGDGETSPRRSPVHHFNTFAAATVTLTVSGSATSHMASVTISNDVSVPTGILLIEGGSSFTTNPIVSLALFATDNSGVVADMRLSNTNDQSWSAWEPYATNKVWVLPPGMGLRSVYAQFRDGIGNISAITNDTIMLDTTPLPAVFFNPAGNSQSEADASATIEVFLSMPFTREVEVSYASADGSAMAPGDYTATSGVLIFAPGQTNQTFTLPIQHDDVIELNETLTLHFTSVSNGISGPPLTFSILDDDPPTVGFRSGHVIASEGGGPVTVDVSLSAPSGRAIYVDYATTTNGTAIVDQDYQSVRGLLVFGPGQTNQSFSVGITNDILDELSETVEFVLFNATNATLAAVAATLTILDDDPPSARLSATNYFVSETSDVAIATMEVWLSKPYSQLVTVSWKADGGTATKAADYFLPASGTLAFGPGVTNQAFELGINLDNAVEGDETVRLLLHNHGGVSSGIPSEATLTILDDDVPPRVVGVHRTEGGLLAITLFGAVGQRFAMQISTNLPQWTQWRTFTNTTGSMMITDPVAPNAGPRFYRAVFPAP